MSTSLFHKIVLPEYGEVDTTFPDLGIRCLPGRIAALSHPFDGKRGSVYIPDRERYWPDVATVVSSGVRWIQPGEVGVFRPSHGAFKEGWEERELRMFGVVCPWWHSLMGKWTPDGFVPGPGWTVVEREKVDQGFLDTTEEWAKVGKVLGDNTDTGTKEGERIYFGTHEWWEMVGMPESHVLVWTKDASKRYCRGME